MNPDNARDKSGPVVKILAWLLLAIFLLWVFFHTLFHLAWRPLKNIFQPIQQRWRLWREDRSHPRTRDGFDPDYDLRAQQVVKQLAETGALGDRQSELFFCRPWNWPIISDQDDRHAYGVAWSAEIPHKLIFFSWPLKKMWAGADFSGLGQLRRLRLDGCELSSIDLGGCHALENLELPRQGLKSIDLSQVPALRRLDLSGNALSEVDLSAVPALETLDLGYNRLRELDLSGLGNLENLNLSRNVTLTSLELRRNPQLRKVYLDGCPLAGLDLSHNPDLQAVSLSGLAEVDIRSNRALVRLLVQSDGLRRLLSLPDHPGLEYLSLDGPIQEVPLAHFPGLEECRLQRGVFKHLDFRRCPRLRLVRIDGPHLEELDFSANQSLYQAAINGAGLQRLNIRNVRSLRRLRVDRSRIKSLDLSDNGDLWELKIRNSPLTEISLGSNQLSRLEAVDLSGCRLPLSGLRFWAALGDSGEREGYAKLNDQEEVIFENLRLATNQELDLSAEAEIEGCPTVFKVYGASGGQSAPEHYREEGGRFKFRRPGVYRIGMSNPKVRSWGRGRRDENNPHDDEYVEYETDVTAYTGYITVL